MAKVANLPDVSKASKESPILIYVMLTLVEVNLKSLREVDVKHPDFIEQVLHPIMRDGQNTPVSFIQSTKSREHPVLRMIESGPLAGQYTVETPVELHDGRHRHRALQMIAADEVDPEFFGEGKDKESFVFLRGEYHGELSEYDRLRLQVSYNKSKVETKPIEISSQCAKLFILNGGVEMKELAADLGINKSTLSSIMNLNRLPNKVREFIKDNKITAANQYEMGRLYKLGDAVDWDDLCDKATTQSTKDFKDLCGEVKKKCSGSGKDPNVYSAPDAKVMKGDDIIALFKAGAEKLTELGISTAADLLAYIVQQDEKYLAKHKKDWEDRQRQRKDKKAEGYIKTAAGNYINVEKDDTIADVFTKLETCDHEDAPGVLQSLQNWIVKFRAGEVEIPGKNKKGDKAKAKAPAKKSSSKKARPKTKK
jgi:hypothetical protein